MGLLLDWAFGWTWSGPVAAVVVAGVAGKEGVEAWRCDQCDDFAVTFADGKGYADDCCTTEAKAPS